MSKAGRILLQFNQWREARRYRQHLKNGTEVYWQKRSDDSGSQESIIKALDFRHGPMLLTRDGASAAHTFYEIFLEDHYPRKFLKNAEVIVDVGANIGLFTYYARIHSPKARILAFEADPSTFAVLSNNSGRIGVECFLNALASTEGELEFFCSEVSGWSSLFPVMGAERGRSTKVAAIRLSSFLEAATIDRLNFLKVDAEGAEYDILLGDHELWKHRIDCLVAEVDLHPRDSRYRYEDMERELRTRFAVVERRKVSDFPLLICHGQP